MIFSHSMCYSFRLVSAMRWYKILHTSGSSWHQQDSNCCRCMVGLNLKLNVCTPRCASSLCCGVFCRQGSVADYAFNL